MEGNRIIAHFDMDAFFASIEERERPRLAGKPIVIGADPREGKGRGVVSTANYKAREYGIRSAMPISTAWRLSEAARYMGKTPAVFLKGNHRFYSRVSGEIMVILKKRIAQIEQASIDEAYADLSSCESWETAEKLCRSLKEDIRVLQKLTVSVGVGVNKLVAKIASDFRKPDGLTVVRGYETEDFIAGFPVRAIPGVGPKAEAAFAEMGIRTVSQARVFPRESLESFFGKWGGELFLKFRGIDDSPVAESHEIKSVGEQETFPEDTRDAVYILGRFRQMCGRVMGSLKAEGFSSFRRVAVTVRFSDFQTVSRSHTLALASSDEKVLEFQAVQLLMPFFDARENPRRKKVRLVGVRVEKIQ